MRKKILVIFSTFLFLLLPLFFASQTRAVAAIPLLFDLIDQPKTIIDYGKEYCDKRSGDLMNLETWYSGKCTPETDTISGEGVGFADIVILQGIEFLIGPQYDSFADMIGRVIKAIQAASDALSAGENPQNIPELAEISGKGLIPGLAKLTTTLITVKPASSVDYISYISSNLKDKNIVKEAYAATPGYGFTALAPILPLWRAFRNITYILFAIAFVLYGIMIMFRVRVDSKTTATIQLAIPKLISTLLLITFSYSIVGFLVDMTTVSTALAINVLRVGGILSPGPNILVDTAAGLVFGGFGSFIINSVSAFLISPFLLFNLLIGGATGMVLAGILGGIGFLAGVGVVISIVIIIAVGYAYFKLIMKLFEAFFSVIVSLIFAPVILFGNILPGSTAFSKWFMSLVGNLAVFPTASFFLVLSYALMAQPIISIIAKFDFTGGAATAGIETLLGVKNFSTLGNIWTPPMTIPGLYSTAGSAGQGTGTLTGSVGSLMLGTIGFGLLLMASKYVDMVREALNVPPFKYGTAIGEALKYGAKQTGKIPEPYIPRVPLPGRLRPAQTAAIDTSLDAARRAGGS